MDLPKGKIGATVNRLFILRLRRCSRGGKSVSPLHRLLLPGTPPLFGKKYPDTHFDMAFQLCKQGLILTLPLLQGVPNRLNSVEETAVSHGDNRLQAMEILHNLAIDQEFRNGRRALFDVHLRYGRAQSMTGDKGHRRPFIPVMDAPTTAGSFTTPYNR